MYIYIYYWLVKYHIHELFMGDLPILFPVTNHDLGS